MVAHWAYTHLADYDRVVEELERCKKKAAAFKGWRGREVVEHRTNLLARAEAAEREVERLRALLREALDEHTDHTAWRCAYPDRYGPFDDDCMCGLVAFGRRARAALAEPEEGENG